MSALHENKSIKTSGRSCSAWGRGLSIYSCRSIWLTGRKQPPPSASFCLRKAAWQEFIPCCSIVPVFPQWRRETMIQKGGKLFMLIFSWHTTLQRFPNMRIWESQTSSISGTELLAKCQYFEICLICALSSLSDAFMFCNVVKNMITVKL